MSKNTRHTIAWRYTSDLISAPPLASTSLLIFIVSSPGPDFLPWRPLQASFSSKDISTRHHPPRPSSCTLVFYFILASSALCALSYTPLIFMHRAWPERQNKQSCAPIRLSIRFLAWYLHAQQSSSITSTLVKQVLATRLGAAEPIFSNSASGVI